MVEKRKARKGPQRARIVLIQEPVADDTKAPLNNNRFILMALA
jgi:hypothetical protein